METTYNKVETKDLKEQFFKEMHPRTIQYLENVSEIHQNLMRYVSYSKRNPSDVCVVSLILGIFTLMEEEPEKCFLRTHFSYDYLMDVLNIMRDVISCNGQGNMMLLETYYKPFIFGGNNRLVPREALSILDILQNIFDKKIYSSVYVNQLFFKLNLNYKSPNEFYRFFEKYEQEKQKEKDYALGSDIIHSIKDANIKSYLCDVIAIHKSVQENKSELIIGSEDIIAISLLLALFQNEGEEKRFFEKHSLSEIQIYEALGFDRETILKETSLDFYLFTQYYFPYFSDIENMTISDIIKKLFDGTIKSSVIFRLAQYYKSNYEILKREIETGIDYESSLTIPERIELLKKQSVDSLQINDVNSILEFGNSLTMHSRYIHDELPKIMLKDSNERALQIMNELISKVYVRKSKKNWLARLLETDYGLNLEVIKELNPSIDENLRQLKKELLCFDRIRKYIEEYYQKNEAYFKRLEEEIKKLEQQIERQSSNDSEYIKYFEMTSNLHIMKDKMNRFSTSRQLMRQELLRVNQMIVTHFITINALEMAKDDLLPLIGSELLFAQGTITENKSLELTQIVIDLFQSLLVRNTESTQENIAKLRKTCISDETFQILSHDIDSYMMFLNQANRIEAEIVSSKDDDKNLFGKDKIYRKEE